MTTKSPGSWNRANETWRLASYEPPTERRVAPLDRRELEPRKTSGDRRVNKRSIRSLFKL